MGGGGGERRGRDSDGVEHKPDVNKRRRLTRRGTDTDR